MTLQDVAKLIDRAERLSRNPSPVLQAEALALLARAERHVHTAQLEPELNCAACDRDGRHWFATAVAHGQLWPLCSRSCVGFWREHRVGRVFMRNGRDWQDELPARVSA